MPCDLNLPWDLPCDLDFARFPPLLIWSLGGFGKILSLTLVLHLPHAMHYSALNAHIPPCTNHECNPHVILYREWTLRTQATVILFKTCLLHSPPSRPSAFLAPVRMPCARAHVNQGVAMSNCWGRNPHAARRSYARWMDEGWGSGTWASWFSGA